MKRWLLRWDFCQHALCSALHFRYWQQPWQTQTTHTQARLCTRMQLETKYSHSLHAHDGHKIWSDPRITQIGAPPAQASSAASWKLMQLPLWFQKWNARQPTLIRAPSFLKLYPTQEKWNAAKRKQTIASCCIIRIHNFWVMASMFSESRACHTK